MIVATPKSANAPIYDLGESPDALIIHLTGGELWIGYDDAATMLEGDGKSLCFYVPDQRTLVIGAEQQLKDMIRQGKKLEEITASDISHCNTRRLPVTR